MIDNSQRAGGIKGIQFHSHSPKLSHLLFADDAILFARAEQRELYLMQDILNKFSVASGQRINVCKFGLIAGRGVNHQLKISLAAILNVQIWRSPVNILALQVNGGDQRTGPLLG